MPNPSFYDVQFDTNDDSTSINPNVPSWPGDDGIMFGLVIHVVAIGGDPDMVVVPSGWSVLQSQSLSTSAINVKWWLLWRPDDIAGASETFDFNDTGGSVAILGTYNHADNAHTPGSAYSYNGSGTLVASPVYTPTYGDGVVGFMTFAVRPGGAGSLSVVPPNDMTERADQTADWNPGGGAPRQHPVIEICDGLAQGKTVLNKTSTLSFTCNNWGVMFDFGHIPMNRTRMVV